MKPWEGHQTGASEGSMEQCRRIATAPWSICVSIDGQQSPRHCPDLWLSCSEDMERYSPDGNRQEGQDPQLPPPSQSSRMHWETEALSTVPTGALGGPRHLGIWVLLKRPFVDKAWLPEKATKPP